MAERVLSTLSARVLRELTTGTRPAGWVSLRRIRRLVGDDPGVAQLVVVELETLGHVTRQPGGQRVHVHIPPVQADPERFAAFVDTLLRETCDVEQLLDTDSPMSRVEGALATSPSVLEVTEWIAAHGPRALATLTMAWERRWDDLVVPAATALARLFLTANHPDRAFDAVHMGVDALHRQHRIRMSGMRALEAVVLSDLDRDADADQAATVALVYALEAADPETVAKVCSSRGRVRAHAGRLADSVEDYDLALAAIHQAGAGADEAVRRQADIARFLAALARLEAMVTSLGMQDGPGDHARMLNELCKALGYAAQADPSGTRLARTVRTVVEMISPQQAADVLVAVARQATAVGRIDVAREYLQQALARLAVADQPQQADEVGALLTTLNQRAKPGGAQ